MSIRREGSEGRFASYGFHSMYLALRCTHWGKRQGFCPQEHSNNSNTYDTVNMQDNLNCAFFLRL